MNKESDNQLADIHAMIKKVVHDVRSSLFAVSGNVNAVKMLVPSLVDGYCKAKAAGCSVQPLSREKLDILAGIHDEIVDSIQDANKILDNLAAFSNRFMKKP